MFPLFSYTQTIELDYEKKRSQINQVEKFEYRQVFKTSLWDDHKASFLTFAQEKLSDKDISLNEKIYLNHQLMRYYVSVEADFDNAFIYLVEVIKVLEPNEDNVLHPFVLADCYFIAYWINQIQYDLPRARKYAEKLLAHANKFQLNEMMIKAKMALAELTQHEGNVASGIEQFKNIENELLVKNDSILINRLYLLLSNAYTVAENVDSAFYYAQKAYQIVPKNNAQLKAFSSIHLARGYMQHGDINKAIELTSEALLVVENLEAKKEIKDLHNFLAEAHKGAGNFEEALAHLEKFMELDKEQASLLSAANISDLESKMADEKHDFEMKLKQTELSQKNKQTIALGVFLLFAIVFIVFVVRGYINKKRDAEIIRDQKMIVEEKNKEIMDSIGYAKRIQTAILPPNKVVKEYLQNSFILYKPKDIVAGDFYWMEHKDGKILFAAADCTGHGVPGAMVSVVCNNGLNRSVREYGLTDPGKILDKTREIVLQEFEKSEEDVKDGMDIALCSLQFLVDSEQLLVNGRQSSENSQPKAMLQYAGAHNPLWIIRNSEIIEIKANKQPIGKFDNPEPYTTHHIELQENDSLYIFSDGYVDQFGGEKGKKFKAKAFRELLLNIQDKSMEEQKQIIDDAFETWKGPIEQIDDVCVIGVRI
ncbi:MAG: SpoIIE family protein phosphatase [Flavobacteriales bacterium]|nr:SpoIIE family protein phosphatase [Flavobacteriales bacterium]